MNVYAGVDIGGTFTKVGIRNDKDKIIKFPTPRDRTELNDRIVSAVRSQSDKIAGVGIACPGAVKGGRAEFIPNLDIAPFDGSEISSGLNAPALVINDGDAASYGESVSLGLDDAVMITLGTGVGGGIVIGGKLYEGRGCAAEIGHMVISAFGRKCSCGMNGCLEAYASATALVSAYKERAGEAAKDVDAKGVFELSDCGNTAAAAAVEEYFDYLSIGIINLCNIFRPQAIIIGGGVSNRSDLVPRIRVRMEKSHYGYKFAPVPLILRANLGENAGVIGAIELIKNKIEERKI